jgi:D-alanyl-D-alanine carboxypeptidase/D-alanyl-D-alanine-endopeptidase (penicillin-binding protein 4)
MNPLRHWISIFLLNFSLLLTANQEPNEIKKIMHQPKYDHAIWGLYVKDLQTEKVWFDINSDRLFSPASTSKLFSVAALLNSFGDDYRFETPVYASGHLDDGKLNGNLILVAQGDLTFGGRQASPDTIAFTNLDHTIANEVPGVTLTKQNPLSGIIDLAKQISQHGIREISGDVIIDDRMFHRAEKRGMAITPIMVNENMIDIVLNPSEVGQEAKLTWRPEVPGYKVENQVKTVAKDETLAIEVEADSSGHHIVVSGSLPIDQHNIVRTSYIKDPEVFARAALIQALEHEGVKINLPASAQQTQLPTSYEDLKKLALWTSPPLSEYAKLILKVSHNLGADLIPLLLASHAGKKTFDEGMLLMGNFLTQEVKLPPSAFVMADAAGGNENRFTPQAEIQLLTYIHNLSKTQFQHFFDALPILGVDGSLEEFAKKTQAVGKVRAKPGTGVSVNLATGKLFLITQALAGYVESKNGHLLAYMVVVNNGQMPTIEDIFPIFEDVSLISSIIYDNSGSENSAF